MAPARHPASLPSDNSNNDVVAQSQGDSDMSSSNDWTSWTDYDGWVESGGQIMFCVANLMIGFGLGYLFASAQKRENDDETENMERPEAGATDESGVLMREIGEDVVKQAQEEVKEGESREIRLTALYVYPIKACAGVCVEKARVTDRGLENDRLLMIVDSKGKCVTQREYPRLTLVKPRVEGDVLVIKAPGMKMMKHTMKKWGTKKEVVVMNDKGQGIDQGDATANFFEEFLGVKNLRLVRMREGYKRNVDERYVKGTFETSFSDGFPYMLVNEASQTKVSKEMGRELETERFRPNLVVGGSAKAFEEDEWRRVEIGERVEFEIVKSCERCRVVTVDPAAGKYDKEQELLQCLAKVRGQRDGKIVFGQNMVPTKNARGRAEVKVGDLVTVTERVVEVAVTVDEKGSVEV